MEGIIRMAGVVLIKEDITRMRGHIIITEGIGDKNDKL